VIPTVRITAAVARRLREEAIGAAPRECCGLLLGSPDLIDECAPTANLDPHPSRYLIDPAVHVELNRRLRGTGRAVVGAYHSHPRGSGAPSPSDVQEANYPEFVHVIVSGVDQPEPALAGYRIIRGIVSVLRLEVTPGSGGS
jgi:proteasome lid subunit RPN8/RPN11